MGLLLLGQAASRQGSYACGKRFIMIHAGCAGDPSNHGDRDWPQRQEV